LVSESRIRWFCCAAQYRKRQFPNLNRLEIKWFPAFSEPQA
jgi:hypothetical protein